jgi:hypothetical protein
MFEMFVLFCRDMADLQKCVVKALETCTEPTPANIVDSMFNFVRKMTPCAKLKFDNQRAGYTGEKNTGATSRVTGVTVLISIIFSVIARKIQH